MPVAQQWRVHHYYQPTIVLTRLEFEEHRQVVVTALRSLPHEAGKGFRQIERHYLLAISLRQRTGAAIDVCLTVVIQHVVLRYAKVTQPATGRTVRGGVYVVGVARPEPDTNCWFMRLSPWLTRELRRTVAGLSAIIDIMKRISTEAHQALREALAVLTWNKRPFETLLRTALRDHPELLAGLNFTEPKRMVADALVDRLAQYEDKYQDVSVQLMLEVASMTRFPNIEQIKDEDDRTLRLTTTRSAVQALKTLTEQFSSHVAAGEKAAAQREADRAHSESILRFDEDVEALKMRFLTMRAEQDVHKRGYEFEALLADLFLLFDMEPRMAYNLELEQIDGSFNFDTDDYIVEARWRKDPSDRGDADIFTAKVDRKCKNALGLFISVNGFKSTFLDQYAESTSFITLDGSDLYLVLDNRLRLDDAIRAKRRHANETGSCHLAASALLGS